MALAKLLYRTPNLLVLDEPTNHLDIFTKRKWVRTLANFNATIVFVSHDRQFLGQLATSVLELSVGGPRINPITYAEYAANHGCEAPRYAPLT